MRNIKLTLQYDGTRYKGWQKQNHKNNEVTTIQGKLENIISKIVNEDVNIIGCGRTDSGVHAENYVANFHTVSNINLSELKKSLGMYLPEDIAVKKLEEVHERFHARYNARTKTYIYKINNKGYLDVFIRKYFYYIEEKLNVNDMKEAASHLVGNHDFKSFTSLKAKHNKSTNKTINYINIKETNNNIYIEINGEGFLLNMVRIIVGTLIEVGLGKMTTDEVKEILLAKDRSKAGMKAPAHGLTLKSVEY